MQKLFSARLYLLAVAIVLTGSAYSQTQQTAPAKPATTQAKPKTATTTAAKPKTATGTNAATPAALATRKEKFSYALGMNFGAGLGENLRKQSVEFDPGLVAEGMKDGLSGGKTRLTDDEAKAVLTEVQNEVRKQQMEKTQAAAAGNKKAGEDFLVANKGKEGVVTLPSGLQYKILTAGTGPKPTPSDTVVCNYKGTLVNGTEFDSSYKRGQPASFPVTGVIKGWTEALQLMPVGSKWQLFVPSSLAYGESGRPPVIEPNSTLVFEVELLKIEDKKAEAAAQPDSPGAAAQPKASESGDKDQSKPAEKPKQ